MTEKVKNYFEELNEINVSDKIEKKNGLSYLSWAWAWEQIKKRHPEIEYEVVKDSNGLPYKFDEKTGYMVETKVTVSGKTHPMWLPVMDGANKAMKDKPYTYKVQKKEWSKQFNKYVRSKDKEGNFLFEEKEVEAATMFDINSSIMRCLVKNIAMHGLGLYIYAGEDLPEGEEVVKEEKRNASGLSKEAGERIAEDMKETQQSANKSTADRLILKIDGMGSVAELEGWLEDKAVKSAYAKLEKYAEGDFARVKVAELAKLAELDPEGK